MMTELAFGYNADGEDGASPPPQSGLYLVPPAAPPPEYADVPIHELFDYVFLCPAPRPSRVPASKPVAPSIRAPLMEFWPG